ncbi:MAG: hypothetical protein EOM90_14365 [Alphaproteobacteria bacterium]|nr:hypothetical protein [Alphaproteobacteria bacterium]
MVKSAGTPHEWRTETERRKGTPQGGVISPLLANLYLHEVFDFSPEYKRCHFLIWNDTSL